MEPLQPQNKHSHFRQKKWKEAGQLSIFLGMVILVITTFIAFVINVGLFVKAKINLQNAVDAGAYAGAAVQARQLTNIGYLNWEMRNTYKEWLFKYYVFGNIGLDAIEKANDSGAREPSTCNGSILLNNQGMNFRLRQFKGSDCRYHDPDVFDHYNVPSICIHFGSNNNICELVTQPGLPRFNTVGLPSISEQHESFLNSIVATKSQDCSDRTNINMAVAMLWTYGTGSSTLFGGDIPIPEIAADRIGAWVQSVELSLRMRNLEQIVNTPPQDFICYSENGGADNCTNTITQITQDTNPLPFLERTSKAFWSAFRNLSGGSKKGTDPTDFATSFRLKEIPPEPVTVEAESLSGLLINPRGASLTKYYLDLKAMPINYALFYTSFYTYSAEFRASSGIPAEASCGGTKTALPVPGYILGFVKNPSVPTYYAVEGQADFVGLFYPFSDRNGITLKTYAAAKPFGGRIGPALFDVGYGNTSETAVSTRDDKAVSSNYISMLDTSNLPDPTSDAFARTIVQGGYPIPTDSSFWVPSSGASVVGGVPAVSQSTGFGVPNLLYDFDNYSEIEPLGINGLASVNKLDNVTNENDAYRAVIFGKEGQYGLYSLKQFQLFASNKQGGGGAIFSTQEVAQSIMNVRKPTRYEALNYMIPLFDENGNNDLGIDTNPYISLTDVPINFADQATTKQYRIFAPLFGEGTLYLEPAELLDMVQSYINSNISAIETYLSSLQRIAQAMREDATRGGDSYVNAANDLYPPTGTPLIVTDPPGSDACKNLPLASKIRMFLNTATAGCGITSIGEKLVEYFTNASSTNPSFPYYYVSSIQKARGGLDGDRLMLTGYRPGPRQGADDDANMGSPFTGFTLAGKRNSYSVKFFPIKKVLRGQEPFERNVFLDPPRDNATSYGDVSTLFSGSIPMQNPIDSDQMSGYSGLLSF